MTGSLSFKLDAFEGPLDLLLHLISKHELDIYNIEISLLLEQYLEYIDSIEEQDFDTAGDFLAMAARLIYIKTCSLLPQPEEAEELKKELQGSLIEYSICKEAAAKLRSMCVYGDVFVRPPEPVPVNKTYTGTMSVQKLLDAYMGMSEKARSMKPVRAERFDPIVSARIVTVTSKIIFVMKKLYKTGVCDMSELYDGIEDKSARVATFLAVLELTKSGRIYLNDDNTSIRFNREKKNKTISSEQSVSPEDIAVTDNKVQISTDNAITDNYETEAPEPLYEQDEPEQQPKKPALKYVTESISKAALPVYAEIKLPQSGSGDPEIGEDKINEQENVKISEYTEDSDVKTDIEYYDEQTAFAVKQNRFSKKYYWRNADDAINCWTYGRERM